jgi:hypothetical protein
MRSFSLLLVRLILRSLPVFRLGHDTADKEARLGTHDFPSLHRRKHLGNGSCDALGRTPHRWPFRICPIAVRVSEQRFPFSDTAGLRGPFVCFHFPVVDCLPIAQACVECWSRVGSRYDVTELHRIYFTARVATANSPDLPTFTAQITSREKMR